MAKPPPFNVPPAPQKNKAQGQSAALKRLYARFPGYRKYDAIVRAAASRWGMDPVWLLATLAWENGAANPHIRNSAGARGLAQIVDGKVGNFNAQQRSSFLAQYAPDGRITDQRAFNPVFAINYMAWRMVGHIRKYGTLNGAYDQGYNPGFHGDSRGQGPAAYVPGFYRGQGKLAPSPQDQAGRSQDRTQAGQQLAGKNPYLQGYAFTQAWHSSIDPVYEAYAGRGATKAEAMQALKNGWSAYHIQVMLSQKKSFINSPVWKSNAPGYQAIYRQIYGNVRPPNLLVGYAIIHNLGASFADVLRQGKGYVKSQEFKQNATSMANVYRSIFGEPDLHGQNVIDRVTAAGWTADQFADYLRKQPDYTKSNEFRKAGSSFASIFGNVTTLTKEQADEPTHLQGAPTDPRLPNYDEGQPPPPAKPAKKQKKKPAPAPDRKPAPAPPTPTRPGVQP